jgi:hypothetical protein
MKGHRSFAVFFALVLAAPLAQAAPPTVPPHCNDAEYRQFDFWIGDWNVTTPDGKPAGHNRIDRILGGCALQENWSGVDGDEGKSFNLYDASKKAWHQTWVDNAGGALFLDGGLREDGSMVLEGKRIKAEVEVLNRIVWMSREDGSVTQTWDSSKDGGKTWQNQFLGIYTRVKHARAAKK